MAASQVPGTSLVETYRSIEGYEGRMDYILSLRKAGLWGQFTHELNTHDFLTVVEDIGSLILENLDSQMKMQNGSTETKSYTRKDTVSLSDFDSMPEFP